MSIVLHIERLVLDETLLGDERSGAVRAAIEHELTRRLAQPGAIDALRGIGAVTALPSVALPAGRSTHNRLGQRIAAAVQRGLGVGDAASGRKLP